MCVYLMCVCRIILKVNNNNNISLHPYFSNIYVYKIKPMSFHKNAEYQSSPSRCRSTPWYWREDPSHVESLLSQYESRLRHCCQCHWWRRPILRRSTWLRILYVVVDITSVRWFLGRAVVVNVLVILVGGRQTRNVQTWHRLHGARILYRMQYHEAIRGELVQILRFTRECPYDVHGWQVERHVPANN